MVQIFISFKIFITQFNTAFQLIGLEAGESYSEEASCSLLDGPGYRHFANVISHVVNGHSSFAIGGITVAAGGNEPAQSQSLISALKTVRKFQRGQKNNFIVVKNLN